MTHRERNAVCDDWIIDDFSDHEHASGTGTTWRCFTDRVMGGVSTARAAYTIIDGRAALHLRGEVSLENNGGFAQVALDLSADGRGCDLSRFAGLALDLFGDGGAYKLHLRTEDCRQPWQSYRADLQAPTGWNRLSLGFIDFRPHRLTEPLDLTRVRRLGLVAIGEARQVDVAIGRVVAFA